MRSLAERLSLDDVADRIRGAFAESGLTLDELIERSGLGITRPSMSRKMRGEVALSADDCEALAQVFGLDVVVTPNGVRALVG
jgi:transcriptional regulator with XRE-family HTH domain